MGGKLSEGINLSDNLAWCLFIVGLPYPNSYSLEFSEKMKYFDSLKSTVIDGRKYYTNCCWKTINQTIGWAIWHWNDFATIMLVDDRFGNTDVLKSNLPQWTHSSIVQPMKDSDAVDSFEEFMNSN